VRDQKVICSRAKYAPSGLPPSATASSHPPHPNVRWKLRVQPVQVQAGPLGEDCYGPKEWLEELRVVTRLDGTAPIWMATR